MRARPLDRPDHPFALSLHENNTERLHCLNRAAARRGLHPGMPLAEARAFCPGLLVRPADLEGEARHLAALRRLATGWCPWVAPDGADGLVLDISGAAHLAGGEEALLAEITTRLARIGHRARIGLADTRGAAWALAHYAASAERPAALAPPRGSAEALAPLPVAALRLAPAIDTALQRLGLRQIAQLLGAARAPLARRFGPGLTEALDRALGHRPEPLDPPGEAPHYAARLTLPEPIGLQSDLEAGLLRLLGPLCAKLRSGGVGARALRLELRRVDGADQRLPLRLAAPMRDPARIAPLFARAFEGVEAGFGIDRLRLEATQIEQMPAEQLGSGATAPDRLENLVTRIGARIGLENIQRFTRLDSHIPERRFRLDPATEASAGWPETAGEAARPRPLVIFPPEPLKAPNHTARIALLPEPLRAARADPPPKPQPEAAPQAGLAVDLAADLATGLAADRPGRPAFEAAQSPRPPATFRWRGLHLTSARASGPERIAAEWWLPPRPGAPAGLRDYWRVETHQGRRLWLFRTPQDPGWFVQGEFL